MYWLTSAPSMVHFMVFAPDTGYGRTELASLDAHVKAPIVLTDGGWSPPPAA